MSTNITFNSSSYTIPAIGDAAWGTNVSNYLIAIASGALQKSGGAFTLTAEVDFGATYGLKSAYIKSRTTNVAAAGAVRLAKTDTIGWRNNANGGDLALGIDGSDNFTFNSTKVPLSGAIVNADINASAAIAYSKLALTGSVVNADISTSAAIAYSKLNLATSIVNADIGTSAAIAYSKLALTGSIVNADINASAAIAYSKLNLATSIMNSDVNASAAIAYSKLTLSGSIVNTDVSGTAAIAYSKLALTGAIVNADIASGAAIVYSKLSLGTSIVNADISTSAAIAYSKLNLATSILNADISASAAIAVSKLAALGTSAGVMTDGSGKLTTSGTGPGNITNFANLADGSAGQILSTLGSNTGYAWASALSSTLNQYNIFAGNASNVGTATNTNLLGDVRAKTGSFTFTVTIASPGVVSATGHGLSTGDAVYVTTTGALPTGLSASTTYFVIKIDANSFKFATTFANAVAGTAINTSGSQSGTHTCFNGGLLTWNQGTRGVIDGSSAAAGYVGEVISSTLARASAASIARGDQTGAMTSITSITLTPGDWMITGFAAFKCSSATNVDWLYALVSTANNPSFSVYIGDVALQNMYAAAYPDSEGISNIRLNVQDAPVALPIYFVSISTSTTYYLTLSQGNASVTINGWGTIQARRMMR